MALKAQLIMTWEQKDAAYALRQAYWIHQECQVMKGLSLKQTKNQK